MAVQQGSQSAPYYFLPLWPEQQAARVGVKSLLPCAPPLGLQPGAGAPGMAVGGCRGLGAVGERLKPLPLLLPDLPWGFHSPC